MTDPRKPSAKILESVEGRFVFHCPACEYGHFFDARWSWNGDMVKPTITPSLLVQGTFRCHSYVTDGKIQFLDDCTHNLRGQTVELPDAE